MVSGGFLEGKLYFPWILSNFAENILHSICIIFAEDKLHSAICKQAYIALACIIFA